MNPLHNRIIEISKKYKLSHLGSCLTAVDIIDEIYSVKGINEKFVLSCGHAGLALYVVLEKHHNYDAEKLYLKHGTHPYRLQNCNDEYEIHCSTGSLGQGLPIALGMAMADRSKNVYCLISDGESFEGSTWECSNVIEKYKVDNLKIYVNFNNWGAYDFIPDSMKQRIQFLLPNAIIKHTNFSDFPFINGQSAHYSTI